ncbi:unnamed protein product [Urochloa humidicola]
MEFFPDRARVRLQNIHTEYYLHADEDGVGVSLSLERASPNTVWQVRRVPRLGLGTYYLLLRSIPYDRYLGLSPEPAPQGRIAVLRTCDDPGPNDDDIIWDPIGVESLYAEVLVRHARRDTCYIARHHEQREEPEPCLEGRGHLHAQLEVETSPVSSTSSSHSFGMVGVGFLEAIGCSEFLR